MRTALDVAVAVAGERSDEGSAVLLPRGDQRCESAGLRVDVRVGEQEQIAGRGACTDVPRGVREQAALATPGPARPERPRDRRGAAVGMAVDDDDLRRCSSAREPRQAAIVRSEP